MYVMALANTRRRSARKAPTLPYSDLDVSLDSLVCGGGERGVHTPMRGQLKGRGWGGACSEWRPAMGAALGAAVHTNAVMHRSSAAGVWRHCAGPPANQAHHALLIRTRIFE